MPAPPTWNETWAFDGESVFTQREHNIVAAYLVTAGIISIVSNVVVMGMFARFRVLRTHTNYIIMNLAVTDIGVSSVGYPLSAASDLHGSWRFGWTGCQVYAALNIFFGMASIGLLTVVAVDRYLVVCSKNPGTLTTAPYTNLMALAWVNAAFWAGAPLLGWAGYAPDPTGATCTVNWRRNDTSFVSYTMAVIAVNFVLPLGVMSWCYRKVILALRHGQRTSSLDWADQSAVTKMSLAMIGAFVTAWSPYAVVCLWASFGEPRDIPPAVAIIAPLFAKSSTFYNPLIYVATNRRFRKAMASLLRCQNYQEFTLQEATGVKTVS
ncbi:unnamed protein product [Lampetra fluviatilis]